MTNNTHLQLEPFNEINRTHFTRCGRKYRPASSGGRTLNDLDDELEALELEYIEEEEQVLRLRSLRARVAALPLPQPSRLLSAIDTLQASHYDELGNLKTRRELEHIIRLALREKVMVRRAGGSAQTLAVLTDIIHYCRLELVGVSHNVLGIIRQELSWRIVLWFIVFILIVLVIFFLTQKVSFSRSHFVTFDI